MKNILLLFTIAALSFSVIAGEKKYPRVSGIYSSLQYIEEAGDLVGIELLLVPTSGKTYTGFIQISEGSFPFTAMVSVEVTGDKIEFTVPPPNYYENQHFDGTIKENELVLNWNSDLTLHLKRGKSYWE